MVGDEIHSLTMLLAVSRRLRAAVLVSAPSTSTSCREAAHVGEVHRLGVKVGGLGLERFDVAPAQLQCGAGLLDSAARVGGMADAETGFGAGDRGGLRVGAHDADGRYEKPKL